MSIKFTILGCGSSLGLPRIDGNFGNCDPKNEKNYRMRCSALLSASKFNILIDTSPDIKRQMLKNKVKNIEKVFYTHYHGDQTHGINELRGFYIKTRKKISVYADKNTKEYLFNTFNFCFNDSASYPSTLEMNDLKNIHVFNLKKNKVKIRSIKVQHGKINSIAYIINSKCAYAPDVNKIYSKDYKYFKKLKYLVIDCLRYNYHPSHFCLDDVLKFVSIVKPERTILTNLNIEIDYNEIRKNLPKNIIPAYDGMSFLF